MKDVITTDDILGKEAVDPEGVILGTVVMLHINKSSKDIVGITVDQGVMKPDLFVGMDYIRHFGIDAVLLSKVPVERFKGLSVISEEGNIIGIVHDIVMDRKNVKELIVSHKQNTFSHEDLSVPASAIKEIGASVILRRGVKLDRKAPINKGS